MCARGGFSWILRKVLPPKGGWAMNRLPSKWSQPKAEFKELPEFGQCSQVPGRINGVSVQGRGLDSMILVGPLLHRIFCDSLVAVQGLLCSLPTSCTLVCQCSSAGELWGERRDREGREETVRGANGLRAEKGPRVERKIHEGRAVRGYSGTGPEGAQQYRFWWWIIKEIQILI